MSARVSLGSHPVPLLLLLLLFVSRVASSTSGTSAYQLAPGLSRKIRFIHTTDRVVFFQRHRKSGSTTIHSILQGVAGWYCDEPKPLFAPRFLQLARSTPRVVTITHMRAPFARARSDFWHLGPGAAAKERAVYETVQTWREYMRHPNAGVCATFHPYFFDDYFTRRLVSDCAPTTDDRDSAAEETESRHPPCIGHADPGNLVPGISEHLGPWTSVFHDEEGGFFNNTYNSCTRERCVAADGWMPLVAVADDAAAFQNDTDLQLAMHVLKRYDLVMVVERSAASLQVLAQLLGYEAATARRFIAAASKVHDIHPPKIPNASLATKLKRYEQSKTERTPPGIVAAFNERNARDLALFNLSNLMLTTALQNTEVIQEPEDTTGRPPGEHSHVMENKK